MFSVAAKKFIKTKFSPTCWRLKQRGKRSELLWGSLFFTQSP